MYEWCLRRGGAAFGSKFWLFPFLVARVERNLEYFYRLQSIQNWAWCEFGRELVGWQCRVHHGLSALSTQIPIKHSCCWDPCLHLQLLARPSGVKKTSVFHLLTDVSQPSFLALLKTKSRPFNSTKSMHDLTRRDQKHHESMLLLRSKPSGAHNNDNRTCFSESAIKLMRHLTIAERLSITHRKQYQYSLAFCKLSRSIELFQSTNQIHASENPQSTNYSVPTWPDRIFQFFVLGADERSGERGVCQWEGQ